MINKKILYVLAVGIIIVSIVLIIVMHSSKNEQEIYQDENTDLTQEEFNKVGKANSTEELQEAKNYLLRFWNLCLTDNIEGIQALCKNFTKEIPKSIDTFSLDELYITNGGDIYFLKADINNEKYYYIIVVRAGAFEIIEINNSEYDAYIENYEGKYNDYEIEANLYNSTAVNDNVEAMFYLNIFQNDLRTNLNKAYKELKEQYAAKRFGDYNAFKQYAQNNKERLLGAKVSNCTITTDEVLNKKFVFNDQYSIIYIIESNSENKFTIQLDDYTLENEEFNSYYEKASNMDKAKSNCDKFFKMINTQDYASAYNILDENFKATNFKTLQDFEKYIKAKLYTYNKINFKEYNSSISGIHQFKIGVTDYTKTNSENEKEFNIIMKLLDGTDFVMSFDVK